MDYHLTVFDVSDQRSKRYVAKFYVG